MFSGLAPTTDIQQRGCHFGSGPIPEVRVLAAPRSTGLLRVELDTDFSRGLGLQLRRSWQPGSSGPAGLATLRQLSRMARISSSIARSDMRAPVPFQREGIRRTPNAPPCGRAGRRRAQKRDRKSGKNDSSVHCSFLPLHCSTLPNFIIHHASPAISEDRSSRRYRSHVQPGQVHP
jgi:hypothetical protein